MIERTTQNSKRFSWFGGRKQGYSSSKYPVMSQKNIVAHKNGLEVVA